MREELYRELQKLRKLQRTRLSDGDRAAITARIKDLQYGDKRGAPAPSPFVLGTFDRPEQTSSPAQEPVPKPVPEPSSEQVAASEPCSAQVAGEEGKPHHERSHVPEVPLTPQQIIERTKLLAEIADRIMLLRAAWATNLSPEIAREAEAWLTKLQQIAATVPREDAEHALGTRAGLLDQTVRVIPKPQISERLQQRLLPPSAPNHWDSETMSELYFMSRGYRRRVPETQRRAGSMPDGLDQFIL